jgi:glycosyltransferase involved in cell wall biosynthesis
MRILFLTDNFPPETNAPATRTFEHARVWVAEGHEVTVVTCAPNFPAGKLHHGFKNRIFSVEQMSGIQVLRVWTYIAPNEGFIKRTLDYLSFMVSAIALSWRFPKADIIVGTSPQFFSACAAYFLAAIRGRPFVFELRDLWPDSIVAVGAMSNSAPIRILRRLEYFLYRRADMIVSVTHSFKRVLVGNGVDENKIVVVPNGLSVDDHSPGPRSSELADSLAVTGKIVAAYVGTIGMAHGLRVILDGAQAIKASRPDVHFVIVGEGAERQELMALASKRDLTNVTFVGPVSKDRVKDFWRLADIALVLLRSSPVFEHVIPSKMFEAMGMERPIVLGVVGESAEILRQARAGVAVSPESSDQLVAAILNLADDPELRSSLGKAGRAFVTKQYNRRQLAMLMLENLQRVQNARR